MLYYSTSCFVVVVLLVLEAFQLCFEEHTPGGAKEAEAQNGRPDNPWAPLSSD